MDSYVIALWISAILELIVLICFFVLCHNIKQIKKYLIYFKSKDFPSKYKVGDEVIVSGVLTATVQKVNFDGYHYKYVVGWETYAEDDLEPVVISDNVNNDD